MMLKMVFFQVFNAKMISHDLPPSHTFSRLLPGLQHVRRRLLLPGALPAPRLAPLARLVPARVGSRPAFGIVGCPRPAATWRAGALQPRSAHSARRAPEARSGAHALRGC